MSDILLNFEDGLGSYLTTDQIKEQAPIVFAEAPTNPDVSKKYLFVNTEKIIDDLDKLGWQPVEVAQRKGIKKEGTIFSKHMVAFQNPDIKITSGDGDDAYPRILLTNTHDGMQAFKFSVGIFRLVCSNGLVVADEQFSDFKIKHKGYTFDELRGVVNQAVADLPNKVEVLNQMKQRVLTQDEKNKLALDAMLIRAGIEPGSEKAKKFNYDDETIIDILSPPPHSDKGLSLSPFFPFLKEHLPPSPSAEPFPLSPDRNCGQIKSSESDIPFDPSFLQFSSCLLSFSRS